MTDDPRFAEPIPNVTVALGRDASLPCVVENLGKYKVWYFCWHRGGCKGVGILRREEYVEPAPIIYVRETGLQ